ncbi:hypothetical protein ACIQ9I_03005 [Streptomyces sp. NPDC094461]|uniref:hypothetical protein n=1 Tax=unclassified Streptomyces TaxID=2593676 RepID=UPI0038014495
MNSATPHVSTEEFTAGVRNIIRSLRDAFLRDEDLADDLDAVLGAPAGPTGVAGMRHQQKRRPRLFSCVPSSPSSGAVARLGRSVTRLDRALGHIVDIAMEREWEPPYPNVAKAITRAKEVRAQQRRPVNEFGADRAHLRRLAMAADDLLSLLVDDEAEVTDDAAA